MRFNVKITPAANAGMDQIRPMLRNEIRAIWGLYKDGFIREIFLTETPGTVIMLAEGINKAAIEARLQELPMASAGLLAIDIHELRPYSNWEMLFAN